MEKMKDTAGKRKRERKGQQEWFEKDDTGTTKKMTRRNEGKINNQGTEDDGKDKGKERKRG